MAARSPQANTPQSQGKKRKASGGCAAETQGTDSENKDSQHSSQGSAKKVLGMAPAPAPSGGVLATEAYRSAGAIGREMVEGEEAVQAAADTDAPAGAY